MATLSNSFIQLLAKHPKSHDVRINYGTAGFRYKASELDSVVFRVGILASLRSSYKGGAAIGLMITASHNPEDDNGVKIIDPNGGMLESSWEVIATELANVQDAELEENLQVILEQIPSRCKGLVFIARDTRRSSPQLANTAMEGVQAAEGSIVDLGLLTTPQLHFIVADYNSSDSKQDPTVERYYAKLCESFSNTNDGKANHPGLALDCANGVGAEAMAELLRRVDEILLKVKLCNTGGGTLNYRCGADFVKINQQPPDGIDKSTRLRCASFDGDADRIVYYYFDDSNEFHLLDGDKLAILMMSYLKELFEKLRIGDQLEFCVVQTAYANGNSTKYIKNVLKVPTACVATGVKHLHHRAQEADVAVYFEANGHGTAHFSQKAIDAVKAVPNKESEYLLNFIELFNQTVGDAISDLLVVETILNNRKWTIERWDSLYKDMPNRQLKVVVNDRNAIKTTSDEQRCTSPEGLQPQIDSVVNEFGEGARAFIRPSGTEDVVRVYAEATTQTLADELAKKVGALLESC